MSGAGWMAGQLLRMADGRAMKLEQPRFNPRPPGVIREGSATDAVLQVLEKHPGRFFTCCELISRTKRTHASVSWALLYLRGQGLVHVTGDGARNPRYLRYRIFKE